MWTFKTPRNAPRHSDDLKQRPYFLNAVDNMYYVTLPEVHCPPMNGHIRTELHKLIPGYGQFYPKPSSRIEGLKVFNAVFATC